MEQSRVDWPSFGLCALILVSASVPLFLFPDAAGAALETLYRFIATEFGVLYLLASVAAIGFLVWLAASRYGAVRLGEPDEEPEFRNLYKINISFAGVNCYEI